MRSTETFFSVQARCLLVVRPQRSLQLRGNVPVHNAQESGHLPFAVEKSKLSRWHDHLFQHGVDIDKEIS